MGGKKRIPDPRITTFYMSASTQADQEQNALPEQEEQGILLQLPLS